MKHLGKGSGRRFVCQKCGIIVHDMRKHKARNRCKEQHLRRDLLGGKRK